MTQYAWQIWFDRLANGDFLKWEQVERMPVYRFLNIMTYIINKDQHDEQQRIKSK